MPITGRTPDEKIVLVALGCSVAAQTMIRPTATYRALELGGGVLAVSLIVAASSALAVVGAVPIGRWIDRSGARLCMIIGGVLMVAAAFGGAYGPNLVVLAIAMAAVGIGHVQVLLAAQAIAAQDGTLADRHARFARNAVSASVGQVVGPAVAGWAIATAWPGGSSTTTGAFLLSGVLGVVTLALSWRMSRRKPPAHDASTSKLSAASMGALVSQRGMPAALSSGIALLIALDVLMAYLPLIGEEIGVSPAIVGALLSFRGICALASRLVMTKIIRVFGTRAVLVSSMVASAVAMAGMAWSTQVWQLAVLIGLFGFGIGVGAPMTASWVAQLAPVTMRATALGLRLSGNRLGQALAPLGLGVVATASGVGTVLIAPAAVLLTCAGWVVRAELGDGAGDADGIEA